MRSVWCRISVLAILAAAAVIAAVAVVAMHNPPEVLKGSSINLTRIHIHGNLGGSFPKTVSSELIGKALKIANENPKVNELLREGYRVKQAT